MATKVNLSSFPYFSDHRALHELNRLIKLHSDLMSHQLTSGTGCTSNDALGILFLLYHFGLADALLVVYHKADIETPILITNLIEGPPKVPFVNPATEELIQDPNALFYNFMFNLKNQDIDFVFNEHDQ